MHERASRSVVRTRRTSHGGRDTPAQCAQVRAWPRCSTPERRSDQTRAEGYRPVPDQLHPGDHARPVEETGPLAGRIEDAGAVLSAPRFDRVLAVADRDGNVA